jgi:beta-galactosidase/beta-glucuronidase
MTQSDCATSCAYDPACYYWYHLDGSRTCTHGGAFAGCIPAKDNATTNGGARTTVTPLQTAYSYGGATLPEANAWPLVDAPHDALYSVNGSFSESDGDERHGYRVRTVAWYRKLFTLPAEWKSNGGITFLRFEGIVHFSQIYINGAYIMSHASAYGEFTVRLDNVSGIVFGGGENVVAVRADASYGSEHWYGGGGLSRPVWLEHAPQASFVEHGVHVPPELSVGSMTVHARAEWQNFNPSEQTATVQFDVLDSRGIIIAQGTSAPTAAPGSAVNTVLSSADIVLPSNLTLWSAATPNLFTVICTLIIGGSTGAADSVNVTVGFRRSLWDADTGVYINGLPLRLRGFSHHNSFAGVGVAMPQRLDLFRAQVGRTLGNNIWRMSHNPYRVGLYDILDNLGVLVWDENRDMGPAYAYQMGDMVKRGRNHASIVINSLCNEVSDSAETRRPRRCRCATLD